MHTNSNKKYMKMCPDLFTYFPCILVNNSLVQKANANYNFNKKRYAL